MPTLRNRRRQINAIFVLKVLQLAYGQRDCTKQSASAKKTSGECIVSYELRTSGTRHGIPSRNGGSTHV